MGVFIDRHKLLKIFFELVPKICGMSFFMKTLDRNRNSPTVYFFFSLYKRKISCAFIYLIIRHGVIDRVFKVERKYESDTTYTLRYRYIKFMQINMTLLLDKPYVNGVYFRGQNLFFRILSVTGAKTMLTMGSRSFQRGTVSLCELKGWKFTDVKL